MRLLARYVLRQVTGLFALYASVYLIISVVGSAVPLVHRGAPLLDVLLFLPGQLGFPLIFALPLALTTAIVAAIGRMREDAELTALMAAGISSWVVVRACLPLILAVTVVLGVAAHLLLPKAYIGLREGMLGLMQTAVGAQVERQQPFFSNDGMVLGAAGTDGDALTDLFVRIRQEDNSILFGHARRATWHSTSEDITEPTLRLQLDGTGYVVVPLSSSTVASGRLFELTIDVPLERHDKSGKPEAQATADLAVSVTTMEAIAEAFADAGDNRRRFLSRLCQLADELPQSDRSITADNLAAQAAVIDDAGASLGLAWTTSPLGQLCRSWRRYLPTTTEARDALTDLPGTLTAPEHNALANTTWNLAASHAWRAQSTDLQANRGFDRLALAAAFPELRSPSLALLGRYHQWAQRRWPAKDGWADVREDLSEHRFAYALRWYIPAVPLALWLLACGMALVLPARGRLLAICAGLGAFLALILPGMAVVKGAGEVLAFSPAWFLWGPWSLALVGGGWLCWRRR